MPSLFPEPDQPRVPSLRTSPASTVHAHCDGGARGNPGPAGYGAVLVDDAGQTLAELSEFLGVRTNNYAEYAGLLASLQWTLDNGYRRLHLISDSKLMVMQMQGKFQVKSPDLRPLWAEARRRAGLLDGFEIAHALRHKNKVADRLANEAMDRGMGRAPASASRVAGTAGSTGPALKAPATATPYPSRATAPPAPAAPRVVSSRPEAPGRGGEPPLATPASAREQGSAAMLRGFSRDGVIHLLGGKTLPDGVFVKILPE